MGYNGTMTHAQFLRAFYRWADAVSAAAVEVGVHVRIQPDELRHWKDTINVADCRYSWHCLDDDDTPAWHAIHNAMVLCEPLRPPLLTPSEQLRKRLGHTSHD